MIVKIPNAQDIAIYSRLFFTECECGLEGLAMCNKTTGDCTCNRPEQSIGKCKGEKMAKITLFFLS